MQLPAYLKGQVSIFDLALPAYRLALVGFGAAVIAGLWFAFDRTLFGARIRAAVDNRAMAQSIGINTSRLFAAAFGLGTGLAALGGGLGADVLAIAPAYPLQYIVYFLIVVAVGGLGSIKGPFIAALVIGIRIPRAAISCPKRARSSFSHLFSSSSSGGRRHHGAPLAAV